MSNENARESAVVATGLGLVCVSLFLAVSLYSHSPCDVMDYHATESREISNNAGLIGAQLAHHTLCLYGAGAWVLTVLMLVFGAVMCATRSAAGLAGRIIGGVLLITIVSAWCGAFTRAPAFGTDYPAGSGGLMGTTYLAPPLVSYFGQVGAFLVLAASSLLACLLLAQSFTEAALSLVGRGVVRGGRALFDMVLGRMPASDSLAPRTPAMALGGCTGNGSSVRVLPEKKRLEPSEALPEAAEFDRYRDGKPKAESAKSIVETRRQRLQMLKDEQAADAAEADENAKPLPDAIARRLNAEEEKKAERKARAEEQEQNEVAEAERRRQEALRQAEAAETERLEREKKDREQWQREAKALEKLDKERQKQDRERAKQQEKFAATIAEAAEANAASEAEAGAEPAAPEKPRQSWVNYLLPQNDLLIENDVTPVITSESLKERGATLIQTLWDFKIGARLVGIQSGPTVTMFELELDPGIKVQRVVSLQDNLAMAMKAENGVRIIAPIPGKSSIGIEIPNVEDHTVRMRPVLESPQFRGKNWTLPLILGRDAVGIPLIADLANMPHLLIAGTTGSGKSVCVNSIILSIMALRKPHEVKLILVDPKQVEMTDFKGIPHLLSPVVTDMKLAAGVLTWAVQKMEQRYERMSHVGVRNIATYNRLTPEERLSRLPQDEDPSDYADPMPYIVIIVDEFADLMMTAGKEIEQAIARLAQKARAAGLHVILATQRPSADVVTGLIKTNLPCRICFQVKSKIDSRIVLDQGGAEKLAGKGDMLFVGAGTSNLVRAKGVFIADKEIRNVVDFCKQQGDPEYSEEVERVAAQAAQGEDGGGAAAENRQALELDEKFDEAVEVFLSVGRASTSLLQRRMGLGYTRAAKVCDQMEARGVVGPDRGAKGRELLITQESWDQFKRVRANNNGSAYGPKGSKDNPGTASGSSVAGAVAAEIPGTRPGEDLNPALLEKLSPVDGSKEEDEAESEN